MAKNNSKDDITDSKEEQDDIARLRRKIESDPERPRCIRTVRGSGYMFIPATE